MTTPRIALIDDHDLVRAGLARMLRSGLGAEIVLASAAPEELLTMAPPPDLVILDLELGGRQADPAVVRTVVARGSAVLVVSALLSTATLLDILDAGAAGVVSKRESEQVLLEAARTVLEGGSWTGPEVAAALLRREQRPRLSEAQERVLVLYASGLTLEAVARHLGISTGTAHTHLKRARAKYAEQGRAMPGRLDVYREAREDGLLD